MPTSQLEEAQHADAVAEPACDVISFTKATGLLSQVYSDGGRGPILMTSYNSRSSSEPIAAMVFNSAVPHWEDLDLGTPNEAFGGPGVGAGGTLSNSVPLGNILVIQNFIDWGLTPNDDDVKGNITFDFKNVGTITATSLTVIDVETASEQEVGTVNMYTAKGGTLLGSATFPDTGADGVGIVDLKNTAGVGYIEVVLDGSIGIDNLAFCVTPPTTSRCTYTIGYWKNHSERWPVASLQIGATTYTKAQLLTVLNTPVRGNGLISLAHQLIAAKLNIANGSSGTVVQADVAAADALIGSKNLFTGSLAPNQTSGLVGKLDSYNNGIIGPGHCN
ncbi:hypothetical protein ACFPAF_01540 [Hymenobacter endophyticus]|uniref:Uncharacterized protein n=1 Tax=Hymenobacter endophyticus TaxID=3076335 RepID=A0ABU3TCQ0_9BACT|nr:hypothetical protein [Hymenobacter endophyticus]MDU0369060.1 hypothetical protein [Hymenobacter endophyticus]